MVTLSFKYKFLTRCHCRINVKFYLLTIQCTLAPPPTPTFSVLIQEPSQYDDRFGESLGKDSGEQKYVLFFVSNVAGVKAHFHQGDPCWHFLSMAGRLAAGFGKANQQRQWVSDFNRFVLLGVTCQRCFGTNCINCPILVTLGVSFR